MRIYARHVKIGAERGRACEKTGMMIFDYGHTLCYEPEQDYLRGWRAAMEHAVANPRGIMPEQLYEYSRKVYADLFRQMRPLELETDGLKLDECILTRWA